MTLIVSEIAVYRIADGELEYLAPASLAPIDDALSTTALPGGYNERDWRWDLETRQMVPNLDGLRARRWDDVKARRDQAEWAGCATPLGRVDTDPDSQRKAGGAVQMAMIAQAAGTTFALDWTMQDNSTVTHDAPAMIAMGVAIGQHVAACHEAALAKRGAIDAAATADEIASVGLDDGWPA